jgi:flagellar biosynthesis chaperone FliJ
MNKNSSPSRYSVLTAILFCYLLPLAGISGYFLTEGTLGAAWRGWSAALLIAACGSVLLFFLLTSWEARLRFYLLRAEGLSQYPLETPLSVIERINTPSKEDAEVREANAQLHAQVEGMRAEIDRLIQEKTLLEEQKVQCQQELEACRNGAHEELKQQQQFIRSLQQNIAEQKSALEKKQQQIGQLEGKVNDLTYEIKTLLQIAESHARPAAEPERPAAFASPLQEKQSDEEEGAAAMQNEKQICTAEEASLQLRRCLDIAQKITGSNRFSQMSAFLDSPADSFSIDLRRLCDSLRSETSCAILFYSPKENQLLFANHQIRVLTGWSPEKFVQHFPRLLADEIAWKNGVAALALRNEVQLKLSLKTRAGHEVELNAHLGMIPTGIFKYHTLAVLY